MRREKEVVQLLIAAGVDLIPQNEVVYLFIYLCTLLLVIETMLQSLLHTLRVISMIVHHPPIIQNIDHTHRYLL